MSEPELTAQQEAQVRRLLADARHADPTPVDVAARLDVVLEGLARESVAAPQRDLAPVVDLAARRRRRVAGVLVAAAAVVVAFVAIGRVVGVQEDDTAGGSASSREADAADQGQLAPTTSDTPSGSVKPSSVPPGDPQLSMTVRSRHFGRDVARIRDTAILGEGNGLEPDPKFVCEKADWGPGRLVPVRVDGVPAVLIYRPASGDSQVVDLLQCGSGDVLRSTTLPLR